MFCFTLFQLDNADEQAAQVRRELDGRLHSVEMMARVSVNIVCVCVCLFVIFKLEIMQHICIGRWVV